MAVAVEVQDFFDQYSFSGDAPAGPLDAPAGPLPAPPGPDAPERDADFGHVAEDLKILWASKPQERGGARLWKQRALALMTRLGRIRASSQTVRQHVCAWITFEMRAASGEFKARRQSSWRPFVVVCLRLAGCGLGELLTLAPVVRRDDLRQWLARGKSRLEQRFLKEELAGQKRPAPEVTPDPFPRTMTQAQALKQISKAGSARGFFGAVDAASARKVYLRLARLVHPDKCDDPLAKACFQKLQNYFEAIES